MTMMVTTMVMMHLIVNHTSLHATTHTVVQGMEAIPVNRMAGGENLNYKPKLHPTENEMLLLK
jgi:hypothetical protein